MSTDNTNAARRGPWSNDLLGRLEAHACMHDELVMHDADQAKLAADLRAAIAGLKFDALGEPRTRYVRVTLNGSHCVLDARTGDRYMQDARADGDESEYTVCDVWLSEREFDDLPEFDGF